MLLTLDDLLTPEQTHTMRAQLAQADWSQGYATAGSQARQVKRNQQLAHDHAVAQALRPQVVQALNAHPLFLSAALPKRLYPPRFNRYADAANAFGQHVDGAIRYMPAAGGGVERVRSDLSCTVFLSEPDSYDGGELVMVEAGHERAIKLPAGSAVLYPSTHVHEVRPVTRGERLACFFWVESLVRSDEQRRLLFEMDMALMRLREERGDDDATVALTGTYHNLLRMWADT